MAMEEQNADTLEIDTGSHILLTGKGKVSQEQVHICHAFFHTQNLPA